MQLGDWSSETVSDIKLLGFSSWTPKRLLDAVVQGRPMRDLPGDFVLAAQRETAAGIREHLLISSVISARPYFYVPSHPQALHGADVFDLVAKSGFTWEWDLDALRGLAWLGHTVSDQSLHRRVRRIPANSILLYTQGEWRNETQEFWSRLFDGPSTTIDEAVDVFDAVTDDLVASTPLVSLSAGFDSRALLSRMLATGRRPDTITMGFDESTDMVVAKAISRSEDLPHVAVRLRPEDYLVEGPKIARITGGTKTVGNWHTYLYPRGTDPDELHLVGANGEFARSYYFDRGVLSRAAAMGGRISGLAHWNARIGRRSRRMAPWLGFLAPRGSRDATHFSSGIASLGSFGGGDGMEVLDRFYATQRVRHFIGNGLALYAIHGQPVSPFLDARWVAATGRLPRSAKLGSNYHRRIIERNAPRLLKHPLGGGGPVSARARRGYWRDRSRVQSYNPIAEVLSSAASEAILRESRHLDEFFSRSERETMLRLATNEVKEYVLTLHFAGEAAALAQHG